MKNYKRVGLFAEKGLVCAAAIASDVTVYSRPSRTLTPSAPACRNPIGKAPFSGYKNYTANFGAALARPGALFLS